MYSGSDSAESQNYTQWALNPSSYQNMSNDEVDWAALAQQWIIMKEAGPPLPEQMVTAPPPPVISKQVGKKEEGGEAPMDVENDEDGSAQWNDGGSSDSFTWGQGGGAPTPAAPPAPQPPWGWSGAWPGAPAAVPPPSSVKAPLLPTPAYNSYGSSKEPASDNATYGYNSVPPTGQNYWTSASAAAAAAGSSKVIKPHNKRYSKVNVPVPVKPTTVALDATKRKQLPAWIREGLEKMERDKLKQMDRSREKQEKNEYDEKAKLRENAMEILKSTVKEAEVKKLSAYDDDSEESVQSPPRRSPTPLTHEEMMLKVRRTMTEILLKVTNREIQNICREELQRHVRKLKASDQRVSAPSGANLSAKLGLGVYDGSGESSAESDEESNQGYRDSDSELRDIIRRRKEDFVKTEREIEDRLTAAERNDENSKPGTPDSDSQVDAKGQERRSRRSEDATPPPPPSKSKSRKRHSSHSTLSDSDTDKYTKSSKDRRSSSSSDRPKRSTRRSRSRTPPKVKAKPSTGRGRRSSRSSSRRRDGHGGRRRSSKYSRSRSRSRSYRRRSRRRSDSRSPYRRSRTRSRSRSSRRRRRSRSYSNGRGKRSHRH